MTGQSEFKRKPNIIPVHAGGIRWLAREEFASAPDRLVQALKDPHPDTAKASRVRKVIFLQAGDGCPSLVLKEFHIRGPGALLRALVLGAPAKREWRTINHLLRAGVAVPQTAAWGTRTLAGLPSRSYLASISIQNSCTLEETLLQEKPLPAPRKELAAEVGRLIREMHDAGVLHLDLHAGNILVDSSGKPYILDLHGARRYRRLSIKQRTFDLISLAGAFLVCGSKTDRLRFFKAYGRGIPEFEDLPAATRRMETAAMDRLHRFFTKFERRCLRPNRRFQRIQVHNLSGMARQSPKALEISRFLGPFPLETLEKKGQRIHSTRNNRVYFFRFEDREYAAKAYLKTGMGESLKRMGEGSRARRNWLNHHRLLFRHIAAPQPVLYLEEPLLAPGGRSYVIMEKAVGYISLDRFVAEAPQPEYLKMLHRLAFEIARMHRLFLSNRDLKAENILVSPAGEILFLDPDGIALEPVQAPSSYVMARDLMRLNASFQKGSRVTLADRKRFLYAYGFHMGLNASTLHMLWREIFFLTWNKWYAWDLQTKH